VTARNSTRFDLLFTVYGFDRRFWIKSLIELRLMEFILNFLNT